MYTVGGESEVGEGWLGVIEACLLREGLRGVLPCRLVDTKWNHLTVV